MDPKDISKLFDKIAVPQKPDDKFDTSDVEDEVTTKYDLPEEYRKYAISTPRKLSVPVRQVSIKTLQDQLDPPLSNVAADITDFYQKHDGHHVVSDLSEMDDAVLRCVTCQQWRTVNRQVFEKWLMNADEH